jgi:phenylacetate-coenzyme A ligase PaaK-like adenylate-forming protein
MADYEALRQKHVARFMELVPEYLQHLSWPRERIEREQADGLRRIIRLAREKSPWQQKRLGAIDVDSLTAADLSSLPIMTKDDLMAHWDAIVTDPRLTLDLVNHHLETITSDTYLFDTYHAVASGGSSGRRGVFVWDWDAWAIGYAAGVRWARWGIRFDMSNPVVTAAPVIATVAAEGPTHMSSAMSATFSNPAVAVRSFPVTMPIQQIVAGLNDLQPSALVGYPSVLFELAHQALRGSLRIEPRAVVSASEPLLPAMRSVIERAWGAPVGNSWGTSEGGITGASCFGGAGMHLSEDLLIIEPVGHDGRPVCAGETAAKIYLTNLFNTAMPLIRYEITDEVTVLAEPCPCGSAFARVADIQGRLDDIFRYAGGISIHPHVFRSPLSRTPEIIEYQVRQTPRGATIAIRTVGEVNVETLRAEIATHVAKAGLHDPDIAVVCVASIERTTAGKLKRFVPI